MLMSVLTPEQALEFVLLDEYNKGKEDGIEKGMEKGFENVARDMKNKGFDIDTIIELTGLTRDKILSL